MENGKFTLRNNVDNWPTISITDLFQNVCCDRQIKQCQQRLRHIGCIYCVLLQSIDHNFHLVRATSSMSEPSRWRPADESNDVPVAAPLPRTSMSRVWELPLHLWGTCVWLSLPGRRNDLRQVLLKVDCVALEQCAVADSDEGRLRTV